MSDDAATTLARLLGDFRHSAFRLEARDRYLVPEEYPSLAAYLRGDPHPPADPEFDEWLEGIRQARAAGKVFTRVHAIVGKLTPYLRYELEWGYSKSAPAGEDVRILHRASWAETPFRVQPADFWLIDDEATAWMHYADNGVWQGADVRTDPDTLSRSRAQRDAAIRESVPLRDYLAALRRTPIDPSKLLPTISERIAS